MSHTDKPLSTHFYRAGQQLAELSELPCRLARARLVLTEVPPSPELQPALKGLGLIDEWQGQTHWEARLLLDLDDDDWWERESLEISLEQAGRQLALGSARALEALLLEHPQLPGPAQVRLLHYPDGDVGAILLAYCCLPEVGQVRVSASAPTLLGALRVLQRLLPEAQLPD